MTSEKMNLLVTLNANYIPYSNVMLSSLIHSNPDCFFDVYLLPYSIHAAAASDLCKKRINMSSQGYSTVEAMRHCKIPVLFIHGTDDKFVPVEMTYENYKACASEKELLIVPGAGHGMSYLTDKGKYERELTIFWKKCDGFESARKRI